MAQTSKERLIEAIDNYNKAQADTDKHLDFYEVMDSLDNLSDETIQKAIEEIAQEMDIENK